MADNINVAIKRVEEHILGPKVLQALEVGIELVERALTRHPVLLWHRRLGAPEPNAGIQRGHRFPGVHRELPQARPPFRFRRIVPRWGGVYRGKSRELPTTGERRGESPVCPLDHA